MLPNRKSHIERYIFSSKSVKNPYTERNHQYLSQFSSCDIRTFRIWFPSPIFTLFQNMVFFGSPFAYFSVHNTHNRSPFFFGQAALNYKATNSYSFILKQRQLENPEITGIFLPNKRASYTVDCFLRVIQPGLESLAQLLWSYLPSICVKKII